MFQQWLQFWRQWMFWWLPGGDEPEKDKPGDDQNQQATRTASETEGADVDAAATWRPAPGEPAVAKPKADDLTEIKGIGPAIARKLEGLGVRAFADLAAVDPAAMAAQIPNTNINTKRVEIWIEEAQKRLS